MGSSDRIFFRRLSLGLALAFVATTESAAACGPGSDGWFTSYSYVVSPGLNTPSSIESAFWAFGYGDPLAGAGHDNGSWGDTDSSPSFPSGWLIAGGPGAFLQGAWSSPDGVDGCITGRIAPSKPVEIMVAAFSDDEPILGDGLFAVAATARQPGFYEYDFTFEGSQIELARIPRPGIASSTRIGPGLVRVEVRGPTLELVSPGVFSDGSVQAAELVTGFRLYSRLADGPSWPEPSRRRDSGWTPAAPPAPLGQLASAILGCGCPNSLLAISLVFDGGFETEYLSQPRLLQCYSCTVWIDLDEDGYTSQCCSDPADVDCNDGNPFVHPNAPESCNGLDDDCDGLVDEDPLGVDPDGDGVASACDVCPSVRDPAQYDRDGDGDGNACDLDDGVIELSVLSVTDVSWQPELGFDGWNLYRSSLEVLREEGLYTQAPGSNPIAGRFCGLPATTFADALAPPAGSAAFFLVSGLAAATEGDLGEDGDGIPRPNDHPCP